MNITINVRTVLAIASLIFFSSCTSEPDIIIPEEIAALENLTVISASVEEVSELNLERTARFGDTDEVIIGRMGHVAVDGAGRVYIADGNRLVIHVYRPDGSHITEIGREGDGPGEFRRISFIEPYGDYLHVMDGSSLRISRFNLEDFSISDDVAVPYDANAEGGYIQYPGTFSVLDPDTYMIHFGVGYSSGGEVGDKPQIAGRLLNREDGTFQDGTVYNFPASEALVRREEGSLYVTSAEYKRTSHVEMDEENSRMVHGWSEDLLFKFYNADGSYRQAVYVPYENTTLSRNEVLAEYADAEEPWKSMIRNDEMPAAWPAFNSVLVDDNGRIWTSLFTDDPETFTWIVINPGIGEVEAAFDRDRGWRLMEVRDGYIYARETDEETGLMEVVKYGIDL